MDGFKDLHPAVLFLYYLTLIFTTVITLHPVMLILSLCGGIFYYALLAERQEFIKDICFYFFIFVVIALSNPVFSHRGETVIFYVNDNPITKESLMYGISASAMIVSVMFWCKCYGKIMDTDKILYLFGKSVPKLSVIISMAFRFIPAFKRQSQNVTDVQKIMGLKKKYGRLGGSLRIFDSVLGWAMENSVDTADAMACRGFGHDRRTSYSIFCAGMCDYISGGFIFIYFIIFVYGMVKGIYGYSYYPVTDTVRIDMGNLAFYFIHGIAVFIPFGYTLFRNIMVSIKFRRQKEQEEWT